MSTLMADMALIAPEIMLVLVAMGLLMVGAFRGNNSTPSVYGGAVMVIIYAIYLVGMLPAAETTAFHGLLVSDGFTKYAKILVLLGALFVLLISGDWLMREENRRFEYPVLFILSVVGMLLMVSANNFMSLYVALELSSLALYVMASFSRDNDKSTEAGLKYFVLGALASGMLLFGISIVYGFTGSVGFEAIAASVTGSTAGSAAAGAVSAGLVFGLIFVVVGFLFKISAVPFHMWTPDVYEGAPTPVTAFFAVAPKMAALALFMRVLMEPFSSLLPQWQQVLVFVSVLTMITGAFGALTQTNIKRLLAYSSIGHVGYILMGIATGTVEGAQGVLIYLPLYLFMSVGAFAIVLLMRREEKSLESIYDLAGLSETRPLTAFLLSAFLISMAGIPPLAGFFGKMYVFLAALHSGLILLAVVGVLSSVVACYYYIKIVKIMYFDESSAPFDSTANLTTRVVLLICGVITAGFFLSPNWLVHQAKAAAEALLL